MAGTDTTPRAGRNLVRNVVLPLDGQARTDTDFHDCVLIDSGGEPPILNSCSFERCSFNVDGAAARTLGFPGFLIAGGAAGLVVNDLLGLTDWGPRDAQ